MITQIWPSSRPKKPRMVTARRRVARSVRLRGDQQADADDQQHDMTPSVHIVERTDLIFVHSEARA